MRNLSGSLPATLLRLAACCLMLAFDAAADCTEAPDRTAVIATDSVRVVTLNMAHGRKDGKNQMLLKGETIRSNLVELAALLDRAEADVIALQEADAESAWSG